MFLMPWILAGGFLAAIPIIVHLLHRQKVEPISWGAMQFLLESPLKIRRRRKIDNWLLMLVRILVVLLVVFLLARPVVRTRELKTASPLDVAVVIDHSLSMGMRGGGGGGGAAADGAAAVGGGANEPLFEQGVDVAERISKMLPASGTMSVVLAENSPRLITSAPLQMDLSERSGDGTPKGQWASVLERLRKMKPGSTRGDIPKAVIAARDLITHGNNTRKWILVISDQQRSNWNPGDAAAWRPAKANADSLSAGIPIWDMPVGGSGAAGGAGAGLPNISVRSLMILPAFVGVHRPTQVLATVANSGGTDVANVPIKLYVDGNPELDQQVAHLAPGESTTVRFDYYFPDPGSHWVKVESTLVDALDADNAAFGAVNVWPKLRVLVVDGALTAAEHYPQAEFLEAAMQPVDPSVDPVALIEPRVISIAEFSKVRLEDYPVVVLNDVPRMSAGMIGQLAERAQAGNGVWIILGPRTEEAFINDVLAKSVLAPVTTSGIARAPVGTGGAPAAPVGTDIREPDNPAVALLTSSGQQSALADVALQSWWKLAPQTPEMHTVVATTTPGGGDPLILEMSVGKLGGRAVIWTLPAGNLQWSNLPLVPGFVPLVNETLFHLASGQNFGEPRQVNAGAPLFWTGPASQPVESVVLVSPDGQKNALLPELRGDHYFVQASDTATPGLYEMQFTAPRQAGAITPPPAYYAVNIDPAELDPTLMGPADIEWLTSGGYLKGTLGDQSLAAAMNATEGSFDLWWILGFMLLLGLIVETWMTHRLVRQQSGAELAESDLGKAMPAGALATAAGGGS